jgi:hypothetical protein
MQASGALKMKNKQGPLPMQSDILTRYMQGGSWRASLSNEGRRKVK